MPAERTTYAQAKYWILTIPHASFTPYLPEQCSFIKGQLERGESTTTSNVVGSTQSEREQGPSVEPSGYLHWQVLVHFKKKLRLRGVRDIFGPWHAEPTRSEAASDYVWKDDTSIPGTRFELGALPRKRGSEIDWDAVKANAKIGKLDDIPADIYVRNYNSLRRIETDHLQPIAMQRTVKCYWGRTGSGKSRRAWEEAGMEAYPKDPRTKFWDGYRGHENVVMDEFRGDIDIAHMLRWLDRYPVIIEVKGSSTVLKAEKIWITSNIHPSSWYPVLDNETRDALLRRIEIIEMN